MRLTDYAAIGTLLIAATAARAETSPITGRFQGTGRACYGTLAVQAKTISWLTPFSQCKSMRYELVDQARQSGQSRMTYRLMSSAGTCRYAVLSLTHRGPAKNTGWEVTGYDSEKSYLADKSRGYNAKSEDMMSCYLIREAQN